MVQPLEGVDILVCGAGTAGTIAAIQAARAGASALLIEPNGMPGGTGTVGGVDFPGLFHAEGRQIIAGIGWELVTRCVAEAGLTLPDFSDPVVNRTRHWRHHVRIDRTLYAALAEEALLAADGRLLLHTMLGELTWTGSCWRAVICCKEGLREVTAEVVIDATGDANAVGMAGFERVCHEAGQPGTQMFRLGGYRIEDVDVEALERAFEAAVAAGELLASDCSAKTAPMASLLRNHGENGNHIVGARGDTSLLQTRANIEGRRCVRRLLRFLRRQEGLENVRLESAANVCGIRQGRTIVGQVTITCDDYRSGRVWPDAVCNSYYPTDLHRPDGVSGTQIVPMPEGVVATIPRGAMIPRGSRRLLVAGQCIAGDQLAHSAYRVQATAMAVGQAAGAIAALALAERSDCDAVAIPRVHDLLVKNGAILPGQSRDPAVTATAGVARPDPIEGTG